MAPSISVQLIPSRQAVPAPYLHALAIQASMDPTAASAPSAVPIHSVWVELPVLFVHLRQSRQSKAQMQRPATVIEDMKGWQTPPVLHALSIRGVGLAYATHVHQIPHRLLCLIGGLTARVIQATRALMAGPASHALQGATRTHMGWEIAPRVQKVHSANWALPLQPRVALEMYALQARPLHSHALLEASAQIH